MNKIRMILMTKSYKHNNYCVAGFELRSGKWIRLVSSKTLDNAIKKEVIDNPPKKECLDVIEVKIIERVPLNCQTENCLINEKDPISIVAKLQIDDILNSKFLDNYDFIFGNGDKCISEDVATKLDYSLTFVLVQSFTVAINYNDEYGKWMNKCSFRYKGRLYTDISLTDPEYRKEEYNGKNFGNVALVMSLSAVPYENDGMYYKFVAKVFEYQEHLWFYNS